ncbi:MAG: RES domain-containing protein [Sphingobacterium mizutaii]|nr:RES domain-containing protein [Sphingobacterium mizutaii]
MIRQEIASEFSSKLPLEFEDGAFRYNLDAFLKDYVSKIKDIGNLDLLKRINIIVDGILESIDEQYKGKPKNSYDCLAKFMNEAKINELLDKSSTINVNTKLFRTRLGNPSKKFDRKDLFHIPFHLRGIIRTQRFSIPGFPCLYLSNSVYLNWEELQQPEFNKMHCCRFENTRDLKLLDLTYNFDISHVENVDNYLILFPLKAACAVKVFEISDSFKSEYIIPQLLMQWINKRNLDGVKYSSTHIRKSIVKDENIFYNLVIPVKSILGKGHCLELAKIFKCTEVVSYYRRSIGWNSSRLSGQETIGANVNASVKSIELFKGVPQNYHETIFGVIEHTLGSMQIESI